VDREDDTLASDGTAVRPGADGTSVRDGAAPNGVTPVGMAVPGGVGTGGVGAGGRLWDSSLLGIYRLAGFGIASKSSHRGKPHVQRRDQTLQE